MRPRLAAAFVASVAVLVAAGCASTGPSAASTAAATMAAGLPTTAPAGSSLPAARLPVTTPGAPSPPAAGASPNAPVAIPTSGPATDWPVYHRDGGRSGFDPSFPEPSSGLRVAWSRGLDGAVYGQPIVVGGLLLAATEGDSVYALDPRSGAALWRRHLGTPVPLASLPCGDIDPLGITSTPAYDPASGSLFVVAEVTGPRHVLFALDPGTGAVRWSRTVDPPGIDPTVLQQRAALAVGYGYVYVGFGGLDGDCGPYHGALVGVPTSGQGSSISYRVPTAREGGIWATGGPVLDGAGSLYVSVGNGSSTSRWDGSDSVLELSAALQLRSSFAPSTWPQDNADDLDLGSASPALLPGGWVFIVGKSGIAYVLHQGDLGGIGGQRTQSALCASFGAMAVVGSTVYVPCTDGLRAVRVGSDGSLRIGWHTASGADGPPVAGKSAVWGLNVGTGTLLALDASSGRMLARVSVGPVPHFASPTLWSQTVFVGTMSGLAAVTAVP